MTPTVLSRKNGDGKFHFDCADLFDMTEPHAVVKWGAQLPKLPLLALTDISVDPSGGKRGLGSAIAYYDTMQAKELTDKAHFVGNPIVPGVIGIESANQATGIVGIVAGLEGQAMFVSVDGFTQREIIVPKPGLRVRIAVEIIARKRNIIHSAVTITKPDAERPYITITKCGIIFA